MLNTISYVTVLSNVYCRFTRSTSYLVYKLSTAQYNFIEDRGISGLVKRSANSCVKYKTSFMEAYENISRMECVTKTNKSDQKHAKLIWSFCIEHWDPGGEYSSVKSKVEEGTVFTAAHNAKDQSMSARTPEHYSWPLSSSLREV